MFHYIRLSLTLLFLLLYTGCSSGSPATPTAERTVPTVNPAVPTPPLALSSDPLGSDIPAVPSVLIVPAQQRKDALATLLKTTAEQLDWVNPSLPDPVLAGQLVVIPPVYRADGETLNDVSNKTGLPLETLLSYNPEHTVDMMLTSGELLIVPPIYIVPETTDLTAAAQTLGIDAQTLLSANPELADEKTIETGVILVVPRGSEAE